MIGIIGLVIWKNFAEELKGFGMEIIAYDKYKSGFETNIFKVTLNEIFEKSDFVSLPQMRYYQYG